MPIKNQGNEMGSYRENCNENVVDLGIDRYHDHYKSSTKLGIQNIIKQAFL